MTIHSQLAFLPNAIDLRLAYRHTPGTGPTIVFLPGYASDMEGGKATALFQWAQAQGRACLLFDYTGTGASEGAFADQTLTGWLGDVLTLTDALIAGQMMLVGSSMGGWLMLLAALQRPAKVAGLIGIAAAPDFTQWGFTDHQKHVILENGRWEEPSSYDDSVMVTTKGFWESGQESLLLHNMEGPLDIRCPVRLLHGQRDESVPWELSLQLAQAVRSSDVQVTLIKDGDHRLSRDEDIALLRATTESLLKDIAV